MRNERVRSFQNVRNPFIDHPEFAERIFTFWQTTPSNPRPEISASPNSFNFDSLQIHLILIQQETETAVFFMFLFSIRESEI